MVNKKKVVPDKNKNKTIFMGVGVIVVIIAFAIISQVNFGSKANLSNKDSLSSKDKIASTVDELIIPKSEVTETAKFYPYELNGTKMEVLALKAEDGSIRTALNTCQVCYDSGRGYYVQEGDVLVCQNCGNRFEASQVEIAKGGCNPVPIFKENKTDDGENIVISNDFLEQNKELFGNWKKL